MGCFSGFELCLLVALLWFGEETTQETGWPRAWFNESIPGSKIGYEEGEDMSVGLGDSRVEGNALEDRYVDAVRYLSLHHEQLVNAKISFVS